ncbi:MAG: hypothetical protein IPK22_14920 [Verrucomicrobiaceae bacterium]|nr:hypothetical protein [Verrucomicrobiaceae bacterium]
MNAFKLALLLAFLITNALLAQSGTGNSLIVAGTTTTNGTGSYAWLSLQPTDPSVVMGKQIAVYRKNGGPASPNPFSRVAILEPAGDVRIIGSLLTRANALGENIVELNSVLSELLEDASAAGTISVEQKMSALITGAWGDEKKMRRVMLIARQRPSVALCAGLAHMEKVPAAGALTYELRDFDTTTSTDLGVVGRVTVDPAAPMVLPAPGKPVELPDLTSKGNLNVSLRWATPIALRDLSPLHHGFDVYRVPKAAAIAKGWDTTPPATTADFASEPTARKINLLAILPPVMLTPPEAANLTNDTVFVNDDNGRFKTAGTPFADGAEFYYFAVARDLLGNGGTPSVGTLVQICDRLPPPLPKKVKVRNVASFVAGTHDQRLEVSWEAPAVTAPESISGYRIYRWRSPREIPAKEKDMNRNLIGIVSATTLSFIDDGNPPPPGTAVNDYSTPTWPADNGKTFFYTVRTIDGSVCGNVSGNSPPVFGVLRDREGPAGAKGDLTLKCFDPLVTFTSMQMQNKAGLSGDTGHLVFICTSGISKGLAWAEFKHSLGSTDHYLGRTAFFKDGGGNLRAALPRTLPAFTGNGSFACRVGTPDGRVSPWVASPSGDNNGPQAGKYLEVKWNAMLNTLAMPGIDCGWRHQSTDPLTGDTVKPTGTFTPTTGSREWKIYRRVDSSPQTLIAQGEIPAGSTTPIVWTDTDPPSGNCIVCYFLELTDEHGNPGPLTQQGECTTFVDTTTMPVPMLEPVTSVAPFIGGRMKVTWMCASAGVERFELWISRASGELPTSTGSGVSEDLASHPNMVDGKDFAVFQTALARHLSSTGMPEYSVDLPASTSDAYTIMVRAVGAGDTSTRAAGAFSNVETFRYTVRDFTPTVSVPWPDRPLPPQGDFHLGIEAAHLALAKLSPWKGNAVRIGEYEDPAFNGGTTITHVEQGGNGGIGNSSVGIYFNKSGTIDLEQSLYTNDLVGNAESDEPIPGLILPVALYRVQVPNTNFATVSGDIVQVSPMMEKIAQVVSGPNKVITDPFIAILHQSDSPLTGTAAHYDHDIFLLDRQPVIKGATYKYLLVRFGPTKEIERVIVTNTVDVPL